MKYPHINIQRNKHANKSAHVEHEYNLITHRSSDHINIAAKEPTSASTGGSFSAWLNPSASVWIGWKKSWTELHIRENENGKSPWCIGMTCRCENNCHLWKHFQPSNTNKTLRNSHRRDIPRDIHFNMSFISRSIISY